MRRKKAKLNAAKERITDDELEKNDLKPRRNRCACQLENLLPQWFPWFVVMTTMVVRVYYVYQPRSWWILHPDEVFQSVEVAFTDVYGYGFYPYEYLPPPTNISTAAEKQAATMGMYGLRSFLYPKAFAIAMETARLVGIPLSPFMVCRIFNSLVTSTTPFAVYLFVRSLLQCHLVSCLACVLTASCIQLVMFGTHCIVNSFTAPFLFFGLFLCLPGEMNFRLHSTEHCDQPKFSDMNGNVSSSSQINKKYDGSLNSGVYRTNRCYRMEETANFDSSCSSVTLKKSAHPKSYFNEDIWYQERLSKSKDDTKQDKKQGVGVFQTPFRHLTGGFLIGVISYVRPDVIIYFGFIYILVLCTNIILSQVYVFKDLRNTLCLTVAGALAGSCFGVLYDWWRYKHFIIPPIQWIKFNVLTNASTILFGTKHAKEYIKILFYNNFYGLLFIFALLFYLYKYLLDEKVSFTFKRSIPIQISFIFLTVCHLSAGHKEARFLHNLIVLYFIIISCGLHILFEILAQLNVSKSVVISGVFSFMFIFCFNTYYNFPSGGDAMANNLTYKNATASVEVNICLDFISKSKDVRGVMIDASIFESHAFSILQHDVPLLTKIHREYHLYISEGPEKLVPWKGIRVLGKYADFIDAENRQYLSRILGRTNTFNYVITRRRRFYKGMKYNEIFKSGSFLVLFRNLTVYHEEKLNRQADELPLGKNATILEYETNWLLTSGLYKLAVERAKRSLDLDQSRVRVFQQLMIAYAKLDMWDEVVKYQNLCFSLHGHDDCKSKQEKIVLHDDYRHFDDSG